MEWWPRKGREVPVMGQGSECDVSCAPKSEFWVPDRLARPAPRARLSAACPHGARCAGSRPRRLRAGGMHIPALGGTCCCHSRARPPRRWGGFGLCEEMAEGAGPVPRAATQWAGEPRRPSPGNACPQLIGESYAHRYRLPQCPAHSRWVGAFVCDVGSLASGRLWSLTHWGPRAASWTYQPGNRK